ncbi:helix-turn-helix transcriptional regulator [Clostridioides sp. ZZV14-6105]|uniref:helix-turn-helix transcriptional regulator n=1 Tax=unclassified Clostridioides TaxID=2635829 RepID=UPI0039B897D2|nr:helix-turn-helix protein [Clostridioides difficile]
MINTNLKKLRKIHQYTQEELAEKLNISRQSVAKWEKGESAPDIDSCIKLAKLYNVKLDDLVNHSEEKIGIVIPPKGKFFFGAVVVGERG